MRLGRAALTLCAVLVCLLAGCNLGPGVQGMNSQANTVPVSLLMTDTPPAGVSVLSFQVSLTSAVLNPGNVQLVAAPVTVEVTRLQTETALLSTANISAGAYTSVALTFASPSLIFQNDTAGSLTLWGTTCSAGSICTASPAAPTNANLVGTATLPGLGVTLTTGVPAALLLDLNLSNMLSNVVQADLPGNSTVAPLTPAVSGAPFAALEDVVGVVGTVDAVHNTFTLQTALGTYTVAVTTSVPSTIYSNFPLSACSSASFACVAPGQIVSVNMNLQANGALMSSLATQIFFEDASSTEPEIEGIVVATTGVPPAQFSLLVLQETPAVLGIPIGSVVTVAPSSIPAATFDVDNLGASSITSNYSFQNDSDVIMGQQLQVRMLSTSTGTLINTDRARLRSSRFTANVSSAAAPTSP